MREVRSLLVVPVPCLRLRSSPRAAGGRRQPPAHSRKQGVQRIHRQRPQLLHHHRLDFAPIPAGTKVLYWGPEINDPDYTSSVVVINAGRGNRATGYCSLLGPVGTCSFWEGTGTLRGSMPPSKSRMTAGPTIPGPERTAWTATTKPRSCRGGGESPGEALAARVLLAARPGRVGTKECAVADWKPLGRPGRDPRPPHPECPRPGEWLSPPVPRPAEPPLSRASQLLLLAAGTPAACASDSARRLVDTDGVVHLTNVPADPRYRGLPGASGTSGGLAAAARARVDALHRRHPARSRESTG